MAPSEYFRHCPACGAPRGGDGPASPFRCGACGFTLFFNAAIATAVFIRRRDGRFLFIRRARDPGKGLLAPPGGFVDIGERAEDAVRREVREEVGLELASLDYLASFPNSYFYRDVTYPVLDFFFVAETEEPEAARPLEDVDGLSWLDPRTELTPADLAFPSMREAFKVLCEKWL